MESKFKKHINASIINFKNIGRHYQGKNMIIKSKKDENPQNITHKNYKNIKSRITDFLLFLIVILIFLCVIINQLIDKDKILLTSIIDKLFYLIGIILGIIGLKPQRNKY